MKEISLEILKRFEERGLLRSQVHPSFDLTIWNYTNKCTFDNIWNDITTRCRGLVTNSEGLIVGHCLPKFFNWEQLPKVPVCGYKRYSKMDGSYIQAFFYKGEWVITSRGSFESDQARWAKEIWEDNYAREVSNADIGKTFIFELIHPENRTVVDYGDEFTLVLLAINTEQGEIDIHETSFPNKVKFIARGDGLAVDWQKIKDNVPDNEEGYVIKFDDGTRMKIKGKEYCRLHAIVTSMSSYDVWNYLRTGHNMDDLIENVPDEFADFFLKEVGKIYLAYRRIEQQIERDLDYGFHSMGVVLKDYQGRWLMTSSRRDMANYFQTCQHPGIMFNIIDGKDVSDMIWSEVKPEYKKVFSI